ncbi:MAG: hypothetical protein ABH868_01815 [bacterium]
MKLQDLIEKCSGLPIDEVRTLKDDSYEVVFLTQHTQEWSDVLGSMLGTPIKPKGVSPNQLHDEMTKDHGGVFTNQTLFMKDVEDAVIIAMYWPWQDDIHTTLNVVWMKK